MSVKKIEEKEFNKIIKEGNVIVDCYADWCGPCKMISPIMDTLSEEIKNYKFYKLNVDESEKISRQYGIMSIPTILIFKEGKEIKRIIGFKPKEELKKEILN